MSLCQLVGDMKINHVFILADSPNVGIEKENNKRSAKRDQKVWLPLMRKR